MVEVAPVNRCAQRTRYLAHNPVPIGCAVRTEKPRLKSNYV